ncbi:DegT/DnrJ/EryC1/StrS family aminotransferase [Paucihalobacter sp.]|uniref:DegT/DnrJ/EryC1/StrS family aminotransferase n=1 Tax=Paucihalobacter sp. TaxID=2850405 RepID=UPI002FE3DFFA
MIKFLDLQKINAPYKAQFQQKLETVINNSQYILGTEVAEFESNFAKFCGTTFCLGTANGLDALSLILKAYIHLGRLQVGDEVLVPGVTFIATAQAVVNVGLEPVFVEPDALSYNVTAETLEPQINSNVKAIVVVHVYGQLADMPSLEALASKHNLLLIEDAAQAHGAVCPSNGKRAGSFGNAAAFSFYPTKNLGALGDAGAITTNDLALYECVRKMRNYGSSEKYRHEIYGVNSRLDEIQAAFLNVKLPFLDVANSARQSIAARYLNEVKNDNIKLPKIAHKNAHVFYVFAIRVANRPDFSAYLEANKIEYVIHYPTPIHKQIAFSKYKNLNLPITEAIHASVVSIPISPIMEYEQVSDVIKALNAY